MDIGNAARLPSVLAFEAQGAATTTKASITTTATTATTATAVGT